MHALIRRAPTPLPGARVPVSDVPPPAGPAVEPMRFGPFTITETTAFPPPAGGPCWVYTTLNAEIALGLGDNPALQGLLASQQLRVSVDSQWLWWALRHRYPERALVKLSGSALIHDLAAHCAGHGRRLLLVGSTPRANGLAVQRLRARWPALEVAGFAPPQYRADSCGEAAARHAVQQAIAAWRPDYVVLGLGVIKEHRLAQDLARVFDQQLVGVCCFGGAIDMASGLVRRAPPVVQRSGLECVWRVWQQPARLGRWLRSLRLLPLLARGAF
jgi:N-acetylglucosaminyldiphosphoundecaprenol N-acetyl-beta-D-mannosaminyltransferase